MAARGPSSQPSGSAGQDAAIRSQILNARAQIALAAATVAAVVVAAFVAVQGQETVNHNSQSTLLESEDSQLSTAITAIGSDNVTERIAGLLLLTQNASSRFTLIAKTGETPAAVYGDYTTVLQMLGGYLSSQGEAYLTNLSTHQQVAPFRRGHGEPPVPGVPLDIQDAADQLAILLKPGMERDIAKLNLGWRPAIDLSYDELVGQYWYSVNFSWITAYMPGIDLRGANLESSRWSESSDLNASYLQCADLRDADFRGAYLNHAYLNGANVQGADFRGAHIEGVSHIQLYGVAKWSQQPPGITTHPVKEWNPDSCLKNS